MHCKCKLLKETDSIYGNLTNYRGRAKVSSLAVAAKGWNYEQRVADLFIFKMHENNTNKFVSIIYVSTIFL